MARKRNISTEISFDPLVDELSDFEALLYTWMIPHADDFGAIARKSAQFAKEIRLKVIPGREASNKKVEDAIVKMIFLGLLIEEEDVISFPREIFYKYQHYIPIDRRKSAQCAINGANPRTMEQIRSSLSLSLTLSHSLFPPIAPQTGGDYRLTTSQFETFWNDYPK